MAPIAMTLSDLEGHYHWVKLSCRCRRYFDMWLTVDCTWHRWREALWVVRR